MIGGAGLGGGPPMLLLVSTVEMEDWKCSQCCLRLLLAHDGDD